jgi:hypothetical protein
LRRASSAAHALATSLQKAPVMAVSTPAHVSSALVWGSTAILRGLPKISGRGGDEALECPGSVEVVLLSVLGSGAVLSAEGATLAPAGRQVWQKAPQGRWWCWLSWGQQALPPWSLVCPLC